MLQTAHVKTPSATYVMVWGALLVLLVVSILLGHLPNAYLMNALVFSVATVKCVMVMRQFMHIRFEPWVVATTVVIAAAFIVILVLGAMPDVGMKYRVSETPTSL